jgi:hypothetical protein
LTTLVENLADDLGSMAQDHEALAERVAELECLQSQAGVNPAVPDIVFEGCNVHVRNGAGATVTTNAVGNLILGYGEERPGGDDRSGSHNLVVGPEYSYGSFGGLVVGRRNTLSAPFASISGGQSNTASGDRSSVSGGANRTALDENNWAAGGLLQSN